MSLLNWVRGRNSAKYSQSGYKVDSDWPAIFISYRRDDAGEDVRRIHGEYCKLFSPRSIFWDTRDIRPGAEFPKVLREHVRKSAVVLVVIGPGWSPERLRQPKDWVRQEIRLALRSQRRIIPVLVNGAAMPTREQLPADLRSLVARNYLALSSGNFDSDVRTLLDEISPAVSAQSELNAWRETSLFASGVGMTVLTRLQADLTRPAALALYGDKGGWYDPVINAVILDKSLRREELRFQRNPEPWFAYGSPTDEARRRYAIERKLVAGAFISNERKIRLASDLTSPLSQPVRLEETDYVSSLMTDQMAFVRVARDGELLYHETDGFLALEGDRLRLLPLSRTRMSNQVGVSTLAFSSDGFLVFVQQTPTNAQSGGTLAPSGSGSLNWSDLERAGGDDLLSVIRYGGARELIEECGLHKELRPRDLAEQGMQVYAFARMLHRGGKPEFFCVAHLPLTAERIHASAPTRRERQFSQHSESARAEKVDVRKDVRSEIVRVCTHFSSAGLTAIDDQALKLSYPLHHALDLLSEALSQDSAQARGLSEFLARGLRA